MRAPWSLVTSLAAAAVVGVVAAAVPSSAAPNDSRIAVVSILTVISDSPQKLAIEQRQKERETAMRTYAAQEDTKLKSLRADIEGLARMSPARRQKEDDYVRAKALVEAELKIREARALDEYTSDYENLYQDVKAVIDSVARQRGFQIVLFKTDDPINLRSPSGSEFAVNVSMRTVLWAEAGIDITDAVKDGVKARVPAPGSGGPPPAPASDPATPAMKDK